MSIPTPKTPHWLQRIQWIMNPMEYMERYAKLYPDIFEGKVAGFGGSLVFVNHPEAIQEILTNDRNKLSAPGEFNDFLKPFIGNSISTIGGETHRKRRKLVVPALHGNMLVDYGKLISILTDKAINKSLINQPFSARKVMQEITLQVILAVIFGSEDGELYQQLKQKHCVDLLEAFQSPLKSSVLFFSFLQKDLGPWSPWSSFMHQKQEMDQLFYSEIEQRRLQFPCERTDVLSLLISARDEEGNPLSNQEIGNELITLLLAGYETTASALAWALYWIHRIPEVKAKLIAELKELGENPDPLAIFRLPYLTAVCNETLRIYPMIVLTFPRLVKQPMELVGYRLEQGKAVVAGIYSLHHRENLYPNSKQFKPERFLDRQFSSYEFIPFGGGARRCIGDALAMLEMKIVLATILSNYKLTLVDQEPEKPERRGLTVVPKNGVRMMLIQ